MSVDKKIKWSVCPEPTGRYLSFEKRGWPYADWKNGDESPCAVIYCDDDYSFRDAKSGNHSELEVRVANHSVKPWRWATLTNRFKTLDDAKAAVIRVLNQHPDFVPDSMKDK